MGLKTLIFTGQTIAKLKRKADCIISVPSESNARIQEVHLTVAHIICELIEESLNGK